MRFTQSVDMALHALWYMAKNSRQCPIQIKDLAKSVHASETYLARVMHRLTKSGLLKSIRGKNGGFVFKQSPDQITIADVVMAIDCDAAQFTCHWEERNCEILDCCSLAHLFHEAQQSMLEVLRKMTIADIANDPSESLGRAKWLTPQGDGLNVIQPTCKPASQTIVA